MADDPLIRELAILDEAMSAIAVAGDKVRLAAANIRFARDPKLAVQLEAVLPLLEAVLERLAAKTR